MGPKTVRSTVLTPEEEAIVVAFRRHTLLPLAGQLTRWFRPATICGVGLVVSAAGLASLGSTPLGVPASVTALPMLVIGVGISLPWGLMDGLAVSVVPKERASVATGIFSTIRVAGEGVALAIVGAVLSAFVAMRLARAGVGSDVTAAAHRLAVGDLATALSAIPGIDASTLTAHYANAFAMLLFVLAGITLATALAIVLFLSRSEEMAAA